MLNVVAHLQSDRLSERIEQSSLRHILNPPRYHARHHTGGRGNFGLNAPWFDRFFRTELGPADRDRLTLANDAAEH